MRANCKAFLDQVDRDMKDLASQLRGGAGTLDACAHNYRTCEAANTIRRAG
ncbi:MAG TPA: hypothetical protein VKV80_15675 [Streptosporangiaceae bacterium]|nr:hypothetical protein [Streptosporangiaceae bacterium]